jgi:NADH-quinone oxidoreductase subunit A
LEGVGVNFELAKDLLPLALGLVLASAVPIAMMVLSALISPRKKSESKQSPYECGIQPQGLTGDARARVNVKYYLVAMCFLVFDVEVVFLFPWAVLFQSLGWPGFVSMAAFLGVIAFGWLYLLKRGALEWD